MSEARSTYATKVYWNATQGPPSTFNTLLRGHLPPGCISCMASMNSFTLPVASSVFGAHGPARVEPRIVRSEVNHAVDHPLLACLQSSRATSFLLLLVCHFGSSSPFFLLVPLGHYKGVQLQPRKRTSCSAFGTLLTKVLDLSP